MTAPPLVKVIPTGPTPLPPVFGKPSANVERLNPALVPAAVSIIAALAVALVATYTARQAAPTRARPIIFFMVHFPSAGYTGGVTARAAGAFRGTAWRGHRQQNIHV